MWYYTGTYSIPLRLTLEQARSVSHQGQCDADVRELCKVRQIRSQLRKIDPAKLASELREYGAWDAEELSNHEVNLERLVWLAGCDIREEYDQKHR
jgi:hypothetical protein